MAVALIWLPRAVNRTGMILILPACMAASLSAYHGHEVHR
jgi:hypothetical protein